MPVDLGTLKARLAARLQRGDAAPNFAVATLDGKQFSLQEQKGKVVLLYIGDEEFSPIAARILLRSSQRDALPRQSLANLLNLYQRFGSDPHFVMLGLVLGNEKERVLETAKSQKIPWPVAMAGNDTNYGVLKDYGVRHVPMAFLIGPDGKILAKDLLGKELEAAVEDALRGTPQKHTVSEPTEPRAVTAATPPASERAAATRQTPPGAKPAGSVTESSPTVVVSGDATDATPEQANAIAGIKRLGGTITGDARRPDMPVKSIDLASRNITDAWLERHLRGVPQLESLDLGLSKVTDAGLEDLKGLTKLQWLNLGHTQVSDAGLEHLQGLTNLQSLFLDDTKVTDAGLEHLKGLTKLQRLNLWQTKVTDAGLEHLKGLTNLQSLGLLGTKVTDAGLERLKRLSNLQSLGLEDTQVTDAGLEHLKGLTKLQSLKLMSTKVTAVGVEHLSGFTKLRFLDLRATKVTDEGVKKLQQALPECKIVR